MRIIVEVLTNKGEFCFAVDFYSLFIGRAFRWPLMAFERLRNEDEDERRI